MSDAHVRSPGFVVSSSGVLAIWPCNKADRRESADICMEICFTAQQAALCVKPSKVLPALIFCPKFIKSILQIRIALQ